MKFLVRWRWVFVAMLLAVLTIMDGKLPIPDANTIWFFAVLVAVNQVGDRLQRIERKLDATDRLAAEDRR